MSDEAAATGQTAGAPVTQQALYRLAHFDPSCEDESGVVATDYLVLQAMATFGRLPVSSGQVRNSLRQLFTLDFEGVEVDAAAERLGKRGLVEYSQAQRHAGPSYRVKPDTEERLSADLVRIQGDGESVLLSWREELARKYAQVPEVLDSMASIEQCMNRFLSSMFRRHGVQCVNLLYPEFRGHSKRF